jgi:hypothetical protein
VRQGVRYRRGFLVDFVNEAPEVQSADSSEADSQPGASRLSQAVGHQAFQPAARCLSASALLSWCEHGRPLAIPGLISPTRHVSRPVCSKLSLPSLRHFTMPLNEISRIQLDRSQTVSPENPTFLSSSFLTEMPLYSYDCSRRKWCLQHFPLLTEMFLSGVF